jgi:RNA polymerase sigma factor (sigma-70 family)
VTFDEFTMTRLAPLLRFTKVLCIDGGVPEAYVRRMIVNEFIDWRRKWARVVPVATVTEPPAVWDHADAHAEWDALFARLNRLPRRQRAVIVLRYYGGLSDAEIAAELDCVVSTVRSNASRALTTLRVQLTEPGLADLKEVRHGN